jgi:hypothetical protein
MNRSTHGAATRPGVALRAEMDAVRAALDTPPKASADEPD